MRKILALTFLVVNLFSLNLQAEGGVCFCACSIFRTSGGERKLCAKAPEPIEDGTCTEWMQVVSDISDEDSCRDLGELTNDCGGYFKDQRNRDRWTKVDDGRYHSCQFRKGYIK